MIFLKNWLRLNHYSYLLSKNWKNKNLENSQSIFIQSLKEPETREAAFNKLVKQYKERLYWHVRKIVLNHDDANDVIQNTFIKIFLNLDNFQENSTLFTWMYRIATNESLNFINTKASKMGLNSTEWMESKADNLEADTYFDGDKAALQLQKAISTLPEKQRLVFNMKYFDAMKYDTIADILDTSVGALKASYHHAVKKIKTQLDDPSFE